MLTHDCVSFQQLLDTIIAANAPPPGTTRQTQSPWLFLDAAHTIFTLAKRRVYTGSIEKDKNAANEEIPRGLIPRLEEQPKWAVLAEVLQEIEQELYFNPVPQDTSNGVTLIMCTDQATVRQIREYLQTMNEKLPDELQGSDDEDDEDGDKKEDWTPSAAIMLRRRLRGYFAWKRDFTKATAALFAEQYKPTNTYGGGGSYKRDQESFRGRAPPNKRRRVRGGAAAAMAPTRASGGAIQVHEDQPQQLAEMLVGMAPTLTEQAVKHEIAADPMENYEDYYQMFDMGGLVVVHPYDGENDEHILEELRPRFVVMYDPNTAFIRRVEVCCV